MYNVGPNILSEESLNLHRNENLFVDEDFIKQLTLRAVESVQLTRYPDALCSKLRSALAAYHGCADEQIYVGNGADGVLADLLSYFRCDFTTIGLQDPTYQVYPYLCQRYAFKVASLDEGCPLALIDSPNSITGEECFSEEYKTEILLWDNVYGQFQEAPRQPIQAKTCIRIHSFSKFFALPAIRLGYCIAPPALVTALLQRKDVFNVNGIAQAVALEVLNHLSYFETAALAMQETKAFLSSELRSLGFSLSMSQGNFLHITHPSYNARALQGYLAEKNIHVRTFDVTPHHVRITIPPMADAIYLLEEIQGAMNL